MPDTAEEVQYKSLKPTFDERLRQQLAAAPQPAIPGFIPEDQFARQIKRSPATLRRWRARHIGPPFVRIGPDVYYRETAAQDFLNEVMATAESATEPRRRGRPRTR